MKKKKKKKWLEKIKNKRKSGKKGESLFPPLPSGQRKLKRIIGERDVSFDSPQLDHLQPQTSPHPAHQSRMGIARVGCCSGITLKEVNIGAIEMLV